MSEPPHASDGRRSLPSVGKLLAEPAIARLIEERGHAAVANAARRAIAEARHKRASGEPAEVSEPQIREQLDRETRGSLVPVLNATGVILHTNLGRAPLAPQALQAMADVARGYATLEYDLDAGQRGQRASHAVDLLTELTGAEAALVVNNNAAAVLLALSSFARDREVVVSRGELVEIGGGFRIPDVLAQSGARLVEVGTTNRTRLEDYAAAIGPNTALLLKVHRSNFDMVGFTAEVGVHELGQLARERGLPLFCDAGAGNLLPALWPGVEPAIATELASGANLVLFSGDKLVGGPQAGIAVGDARFIQAMSKYPLMRALRPDKLCLAALRATLLLWRDAPDEVPVVKMLRTPLSVLQKRAQGLVEALDSPEGAVLDVAQSVARVGGGAAPSRDVESVAVRVPVRDPTDLCKRLRAGSPPVIARIEAGAVLLDLRTIPEELDLTLAAALRVALCATADS